MKKKCLGTNKPKMKVVKKKVVVKKKIESCYMQLFV